MSLLSPDALRLLLLDLLSDVRPVAPTAVTALNERDWAFLLDLVRQHRLGPLLHWQLTRRHAGIAIPDDARAELAALFADTSRRQLGRLYELCEVRRLFDSAGIGSIALKGSFLAFLAYPDPALRPLRDLDILVREDRLIEAYRLMLDTGAEPGTDSESGHAAALDYAIATDEHHLPILTARSALARIELHKHVQSVGSVEGRERDAELLDQLWSHAVTMDIAGTALDFPAPTDMLLHLVMHAAYNHLLDNGPLTLSDLAFLMRRHEIDWDRFWHAAERAGAMRGAVLLLDLTEHYWGDLDVVWNAAATALRAGIDPMRQPAALLMLQDRALAQEVWRTRGHATGWRARARRMKNTVFLPRIEMAMLYPVKPDSPRILLCYPHRWWSLATRRLPGIVALRRRDDLKAQSEIDARVAHWLGV